MSTAPRADPKATAGDVPVYCAFDELTLVAGLVPNPRNPNRHPQAQIALLAQIIRAQGWRAPITVSTRSGFVVRGHGRLLAAQHMGAELAPVDFQSYASEAEEWADLIADNRLSELSEIDEVALANLLEEMDTSEIPVELSGYSAEEIADIMHSLEAGAAEPAREQAKRTLTERFIVPPFSVLDSRQGYWRERKEAWLSLGIKSESGRSANLLFQTPSAADPQFYQQKTAVENKLGRKLETAEFVERYYVPPEKDNSTSIFDPVLCELAYKWFCPPSGSIIDPFAGGSVRGAVAALCGYEYTGIDLRPEQIEANQKQWKTLADLTPEARAPAWLCGDSVNIASIVTGDRDFLFTCPPYGDLEVYSDDPADISNMEYTDFLEAYRKIITAACSLLKNNRFACVVVGDIRDRHGLYRNFIGDTIAAFEAAGLRYYNEGIYITQPGGLTIRVSRMFSKGRKLGKTHQNLLVFIKGNREQTIQGEAGGRSLYEDAVLRFDDIDIPIKTLALAEETRLTEETHRKMLVFVKGDSKKAVTDCEDVDVFIPVEMEAD